MIHPVCSAMWLLLQDQRQHLGVGIYLGASPDAHLHSQGNVLLMGKKNSPSFSISAPVDLGPSAARVSRIWMLMLRPGENREGDGLLLHVQVKTINWRKTREQAAHSCCCKLRQFPTGSHWKPAEGKIFSLEVHTAAKAGQAKPHVWWLRLGRWRRRCRQTVATVRKRVWSLTWHSGRTVSMPTGVT